MAGDGLEPIRMVMSVSSGEFLEKIWRSEVALSASEIRSGSDSGVHRYRITLM